MTVARPADILALGTATPVGLRSDAVAAAIRGGLHRGRMVKWRNKKSERQRMSLLADGYLPVLDPALVRLQRSDAARRMVRLATYALREACAPCTEPPPVLLALPEEGRGAAGIAGPEMVRHIATQAGVKLDERGSRVYRQGGAGGLFALSDALGLLASDRYPYVLVGGVDTFFDSRRLAELDAEDRLSGSSMDGFVPGEGAAFLLLGLRSLRRRLRLPPLARVTGVGVGVEKGHRHSPEPYRGDGLAQTFRALFATLPIATPKVRCISAGFNGERLPTKEWGVAHIRNATRFAEDSFMEHPADCVGDAGAALGPLMVALAAMGIRDGYRKEPCLVWSTSDGEARAAAMVEAAVP
jgi:3-oxoacyl-[acyl-carrier-protein] synthase-1